MKSEHRHELKTNELQRLTSQLTQTLEPYVNQILIAVVAISVVAGGAIWFARQSGSASEAGWTRLGSAASAEDYANIADDFSNEPVGAWARLLEAEMHLATGIQLAFSDRGAALSDLKEAQESFEKVLAFDGLPSEVRDRALYGRARTLETLSDGDTSAAIAAYERLQQEVKTKAYTVLYRQEAATRIEELKRGRGQDFYAWFQKQNPKPEDRAQPLDGIELPGTQTIELPGPELPSPSGSDQAADSEPSDGGPATETPPETDSEPNEAEAAPADDTPADSDEAPKSDEAAESQSPQ